MRHTLDMNEDDGQLAAEASNGNRAAFRTLLDRHYDRVFRVVLGILGSAAEAEDVTQEIWAAMPARLRNWRGDSRFTTWLHTVTLNASRDALRRSATRARLLAGFTEIDELRRGEDADGEARLYWLRTALAALSDELRETAALVLGDDLTHAQAAEILDIAEGTVSWRMGEIRRRLRVMTQGEEALA